MPQPHLLLTLGNPSHAADAMDEPFAVLPDWAGWCCSDFTDFWFRPRRIRRLEGLSSEGPRRKPIAVA